MTEPHPNMPGDPQALERDLDRMGEIQALLARALLTLDGMSDRAAAERLRTALGEVRDALEGAVGDSAGRLGVIRAERGLYPDD